MTRGQINFWLVGWLVICWIFGIAVEFGIMREYHGWVISLSMFAIWAFQAREVLVKVLQMPILKSTLIAYAPVMGYPFLFGCATILLMFIAQLGISYGVANFILQSFVYTGKAVLFLGSALVSYGILTSSHNAERILGA